MRNPIKSLALVVLIAAFLFGSLTPVSATAPGPDVIAIVGGSPLSYVATFGADGSSRARLDYDSWLRVAVSPNNRWIAAWGTNPATNTPIMAYRLANGRPVNLPIERGFDLVDARFTPDSRFFMYALASLANQQMILGVVNLGNGVRAEFTGSYGARSVFGANSAGLPLRFDGRIMIVQGYVPFSDGVYTGLFRLNLTGYDTTPAGRYLLPPAQRILGTGVVGQIEFSPDGRQVAVLYYDESNPPANFQGRFVTNGLAVIDLANPRPRVIARAGRGQGLETLSWSPDGRTIYITGGSYNNRSYVSNPGFFAVNVATGQVSPIGPLSTNPDEGILQMTVCGSSIYFVATTGGVAQTLFSAPLNAPATRRQIVAGPSGVQILSCATR